MLVMITSFLSSCAEEQNANRIDQYFFDCGIEQTSLELLDQYDIIPEKCKVKDDDNNFSQPSNWSNSDTDDFTFKVEDGVFKLENFTNSDYYLPTPFDSGSAQSFEIKCKFSFVEGNSYFSVNFFGKDFFENLNGFRIFRNGQLSYINYQNEVFSDQNISSIGTITNNTNELLLRIYNSEVYVFINKIFVTKYSALKRYGSEITVTSGNNSVTEIIQFEYYNLSI